MKVSRGAGEAYTGEGGATLCVGSGIEKRGRSSSLSSSNVEDTLETRERSSSSDVVFASSSSNGLVCDLELLPMLKEVLFLFEGLLKTLKKKDYCLKSYNQKQKYRCSLKGVA